MNIGEANDTVILLRWLTTRPAPDPEAAAAASVRAKRAAARLADRSSARLMAGMTGEKVIEQWPATHPRSSRG